MFSPTRPVILLIASASVGDADRNAEAVLIYRQVLRDEPEADFEMPLPMLALAKPTAAGPEPWRLDWARVSTRTGRVS